MARLGNIRDNGTDPGPVWKEQGFDDSGWSNGIAEIGYGDSVSNRPEVTISRRVVATVGTQRNAITNATQLFRHSFQLSASAINSWTGVVVRLLADDGGIVYLNGSEIYRSTNMPLNTTYGSFTTAPMAGNGRMFRDGSFDKTLLTAGTNTLAVEIHLAGPQ